MNIEELKAQEAALKLEIEKAIKLQRALKILDDIKNKGFKNPSDPIISFEELLQEFNLEVSRHDYKGVVFEISLDFSEPNSIYREVRIIEVKNWGIFDNYHKLLREYNFYSENYYDFCQNFDDIPNKWSRNEEEYINLGKISNLQVLMRWSSDDQWTCRYMGKNKFSLKTTIDHICQQIDLIEKIGNQETDVRDDVLKNYSLYQLEYELKKRKELKEVEGE